MLFSPERFCEIIHGPAFDATAGGIISPEQIRKLEVTLAANPRAGDVIPGTGGVRKLRVSLTGRGKRGGARVIYFAHIVREQVYLFFLCAKSDQEHDGGPEAGGPPCRADHQG